MYSLLRVKYYKLYTVYMFFHSFTHALEYLIIYLNNSLRTDMVYKGPKIYYRWFRIWLKVRSSYDFKLLQEIRLAEVNIL